MTLKDFFLKEQTKKDIELFLKQNKIDGIYQIISDMKEGQIYSVLIGYLALYVDLYGYDRTLDFINSRQMWEGKENYEVSKKQILVNLSLYLQSDKEYTSFLTLKPLFAYAAIID